MSSFRNQSIDLQSNSIDLLLYDGNFGVKWVNINSTKTYLMSFLTRTWILNIHTIDNITVGSKTFSFNKQEKGQNNYKSDNKYIAIIKLCCNIIQILRWVTLKSGIEGGKLGLEIEILEKQLKVNKWRDIAINRVVRCKNIERTFSILNLFLLALNHMVTEEGNKLQN